MNCLKCKKTVRKKDAKHGFHIECFKQEFNISSNLDFSDLIPRESRSSLTQEDSLKKNWPRQFANSFFHGKFKKYSSILGSAKYILKVKEDRYPELPQIEYASNVIARGLEIDVPEFHYIFFNNNIPTFVSRNFLDFHQESNLVHIWHYFNEEIKEEFNCENLLEIIFNETRRPIDQKKFIEICLFDMIIGNHDRHGRNLAIIETKNKKILSPCYDNPSYIGIEDDMILGAQIAPKGKIFTKESREPDIRDYIKEFKRLGYEDIADKFIQKIDDFHIQDIISSVEISANRKKAFWKLIETNIRLARNEK